MANLEDAWQDLIHHSEARSLGEMEQAALCIRRLRAQQYDAAPHEIAMLHDQMGCVAREMVMTLAAFLGGDSGPKGKLYEAAQVAGHMQRPVFDVLLEWARGREAWIVNELI